MTKGILAGLAVLFLVSVFGVGTAHAQTVFTLNSCNPVSIPTDNPAVVGGCGSGPYGTVTLTQNVGSVTVNVSLDSGYYFTDNSGNGKAIYFDLTGVSGAGFSSPGYTSFVNMTSGFTVDTASSPTGGVDGTFAAGIGSFNFAIECGESLSGNKPCPGGAGGSNQDATSFSFTIDGITISQFVANSDGVYFASSVYSSAGTGESYTKTPGVTPEPASMLLFGSGLLVLGAIFRKRLAVS